MIALAALALGAAGCGPAAAPHQRADIGPDDWAPTPQVDRVQAGPAGLHVIGRAAPGGRVVLRSESGAYAAVANGEGVFDVTLQAPNEAALFLIEAQLGQEARPAPAALAVAPGGRGPIVLVSPGAPSVRLDGPAGGLDGVDRDQGQAVAFGRARPNEEVKVDLATGPVRITAGFDGRWTTRTATTPDAVVTVRVGGRVITAPPVAREADPTGFSMSQTPDGAWLLVRRYGASTVQATWLF